MKSDGGKLRRLLAADRTQTLTVPNHDEIDHGTLQASRYIPQIQLRRNFYTD